MLVPGVGYEVNGATRWMRLGPLNLQASEPARLLILLYLCGYVVRRGRAAEAGFRGLLLPMLVVTAAGSLLMLQPDFGATAVLLATALGVLFVGGVRLGYLLLMGLGGRRFAGAAGAHVGVPHASPDGFPRSLGRPVGLGFPAHPVADRHRPRRAGSASGLGESVQKLFYLPEAHTDFVFAVLAEELGLVGVFVMIALFGLLVWRAFAIAWPPRRRVAPSRPTWPSASASGSACRPSSTSA